MDVSQLPLELQSAVKPNLPTQQIPMAPDDQQTAGAPPDIGGTSIGQQLTAKGSPFLTSLSQGANVAAAANPAPTAPGSWSRNLLAGAMHALGSNAGKVAGAANEIGASLGDAAAAGKDLAPGQGALAGVEKTLAARNSRQVEQHEQSEKDKTNEVLRAHTAAQTLQLQQSMADANEDRENAHIASGKTTAEVYRKNHTVEDNLSETDLKNKISQEGGAGKFGDKFYVYQTGKISVIGGDGKPTGKFNPTYSVITREGKTVTVDQATHDLWVKAGINNIPVGTEIGADQFDNANTQSQKTLDAFHMAEVANERAYSDAQKNQLRDSLTKVQPLLALKPDDPIGGLELAKKNELAHTQEQQRALAKAQQAGDQAGIKKAQDALAQIAQEGKDVDFALTYGFTPEAKEKHREANQKDEELRLKNKELVQRDQDRRDLAEERLDLKKRQKVYDGAHDQWQKALTDNNFNPVAAREALRKSNPKALAALADEETRSAQVTESTDPITGETRQTTKSKPTFFAVPGEQPNQAQTIGQVVNNPAAADFQKSQDQAVQQQQAQKQGEQDRFDQRPAEKGPTVFSGFGEAPNPNWNQAEAYLQKHPELDGPARAAVRKQFAQSQQPKTAPPPGVTIPQGYEWRANGPHGPGAYKVGS